MLNNYLYDFLSHRYLQIYSFTDNKQQKLMFIHKKLRILTFLIEESKPEVSFSN